MAENKKRVRATWTQVRELEAKLADQIEGTSRLVKDCDIWREKYQRLFEEHQELRDKYDHLLKTNEYLASQLEELKKTVKEAKAASAETVGHVHALESSNGFMDAEMKKLRAELELEHATADHLAAEVGRLKSRGFWARLFNKD